MRTLSLALLLFHTTSWAQMPFLQGHLPLSIGTLGDAAKPSLEFGGGVGADVFLWHFNSFIVGLGGGLYGTLPFKTGNASVRVKPYSLYAEERLSLGYVLSGSSFSIIPSLALKSETGVAIYNRRAQESSSTNVAALLALGPSLSVFYLFNKLGFSLSYSMTYGTRSLRQHFDLALILSLPV
ncbi:MAG TPA: hypothetical protein VEK06_04680 [Myxococcota bacterium]|nr:hypothetical protein [Myxococcota bacterium]